MNNEITTTRVFSAPREVLWKAWTDPGHLTAWWGPHGFTNTFHEFEPKPGGQWRLTMHGPNGFEMVNESVYLEVTEPERIVFDHLVPHEFRVTATFAEHAEGTLVSFTMAFPTEAECDQCREFVVPKNEENFDRLAAEVSVMARAAGESEIVVTRIFNAKRERVFAAWGDAENIGDWWGPRGFSITTHHMDFRTGGHWDHVMHGPDGTDYPNYIFYDEVVQPERITYTHRGGKGDDSVDFHSIATFVDLGERTEVKIRAIFKSRAERDRVAREYGAIDGSTQMMARLHALLESTAAHPAQ